MRFPGKQNKKISLRSFVMFLDGFKYWLLYSKGDKSYYRCFRSKSQKCPGKVVMQSGKIVNFLQHNHDKEMKLSIVDKFRKVLTKRAIEKPTKPLADIYLEETLNFTEASILYTFQSAESTMRKARAKIKPKSRRSEDCGQLHKFFQIQEFPESGSTVLTMQQYQLKSLGKIEEIHVDCSVSVKTEDDSQLTLITILALIKNRDIPIAFAFLRVKSHESFTEVLCHIREKSSACLTPSNILTSCDGILYDALRMTYPDATIKILWFFYASSVIEFAREKYLLKLINQSLYHLSTFKMMLAIPLIPANYMVPGLDALKKWMSEKSVNFNELCDFIDVTWLASDGGAEKISIFNGLSHSINNYIQVFQKDLTTTAGELTKDKILEAICKRTAAKINKTKAAPVLKKSQKLQKTILETATQNWIKANLHLRRPIQFLQQVSHCIDDGVLNFLINFDGNEGKIVEVVSERICQLPVMMSEPPPLIFYKTPKVVSSEPPPLVPISRGVRVDRGSSETGKDC